MTSWESIVLNTMFRDYLWAVGLFVAWVVVFRLIQYAIFYRVRRLTQKTSTDIDDIAVQLVEKIRPPVYIVLALWVAVRTVSLSSLLRSIVDGATVAVLVYQAIVTAQIMINYVVARRLRRGAGVAAPPEAGPTKPDSNSALHIVNKITAVVLWSLGLLFILSNFGIDVTSLVAGLGVGGIAIALAAQNILGDLFSSLAIYLDKPFAVGDFIVVGDVMGTVTYIGIKTTRLRALSGEEVILSNRELTAARIKNLRRMTERRIVFELAVAADTPSERLATVPQLIQHSIESREQVRFGRAHLTKVDGAGFVYEVVYRVLSPDFHVYRDIQQAIMLDILTAFGEAKMAVTLLV
jgi:small-conductance mechanosensitive channel